MRYFPLLIISILKLRMHPFRKNIQYNIDYLKTQDLSNVLPHLNTINNAQAQIDKMDTKDYSPAPPEKKSNESI